MPPAEIPTLPVLVPATTAAVAVVLWWLHRRGRLTGLRAAVGVVACLYGAGVLGHVLLPFPIDPHDPRPWRTWLHLTPLVDVVADPIGIVLNVALFVPLGLLLPLVARVGSIGRAAVVGLVVSLGIETAQFLGAVTVSPGRIADVDDLIGNTIGTVLGYAAFSLLVTIPVAARLADRAAFASVPEQCESAVGHPSGGALRP